MLHKTAILTSPDAMVASIWPQSSNLTSDLKSATSITLVSMCMVPLTANLSEAMAASKRTQRSHLASESKSVTSITYDAWLLCPLRASMS